MYFGYEPSIRCGVGKILSHFTLNVLLTMSFALQKLFSFLNSPLLITNHSVCTIGIYSSIQGVMFCANVFQAISTFSSVRFIAFAFMLKFLVLLDLNFVHGDRYGPIFILLQPHIMVPV